MRPTRSKWSTSPRRRCGGGWCTATSTAPTRSTPRSANYFQIGNLAALRELALLWVANEVDAALEDYRARHGITDPWETRERIVVGLTESPHNEDLIRRSARLAQRLRGELLGVHVGRGEGLVDKQGDRLAEHRQLLEDLGGEYHEVVGDDVASALVDFARGAERHPARDRLESTLALGGVGSRIRHQPRDSASRADQRPGDVPRSGARGRPDFGGKLLKGGADVTFLVRPRRAAQLADRGLVLKAQDAEIRAPAKVVLAGEVDGPYDVILLCCKAYDLDDAMLAIAPAVGPTAPCCRFSTG